MDRSQTFEGPHFDQNYDRLADELLQELEIDDNKADELNLTENLDEDIHDIFSGLAADINNEGYRVQVATMIKYLGLEGARVTLKDIVKEIEEGQAP